MLHAIQEHFRRKNMLIEVENVQYELNQQNIYSKLYHDGEATTGNEENCEFFYTYFTGG